MVRNRGAEILSRSGRTQQVIADKVGTSRISVQKWLTCKNKPTLPLRKLLLKYYEVPIRAWDQPPDEEDVTDVPGGEVSGGTTNVTSDREAVGRGPSVVVADDADPSARLMRRVNGLGVRSVVKNAIDGNRGGGDSRVLMLGNPSRNLGFFYDCFHRNKQTAENPFGTYCLQMSSENSPNIVSGKNLVNGIATPEWLSECKSHWGEDSVLYKVNIQGEFASGGKGVVLSMATITAACERWREMEVKYKALPKGSEGPLVIGLDPAGAGSDGDDSVFAIRRGRRLLGFYAKKGIVEGSHVKELEALLDIYKVKGERPRVVLDREGAVGARVLTELRLHLIKYYADDKTATAQIRRLTHRVASLTKSLRLLRRKSVARERDQLLAGKVLSPTLRSLVANAPLRNVRALASELPGRQIGAFGTQEKVPRGESNRLTASEMKFAKEFGSDPEALAKRLQYYHLME